MAQRIVIIGSGIIGAALAYRLQGARAQVTVIDAGTSSATEASFGWINASFYLTQDHFALREAGIAAYAQLAAEMSLPLRQSGCLNWEFEGQALDDYAQTLSDQGYPVERIEAARFRELEPAIAHPPDQSLLFPTEAVAEPGALRQTLLTAALRNGARILSGVRVTALEPDVITTAGVVKADDVIVAAGTGSAGLLSPLGLDLPMLARPAYVVETVPITPILSHVLAGPYGELRQRPDGALIAPAVTSHQADASDLLDVSAVAAADETIARLRRLLPDQKIDWARVTLAHRPVPGDNLPVVGRVRDGLYLATMHSGLTLGAVTADLVAAEVLDGPSDVTQARLASFRPERFEGMNEKRSLDSDLS